MKVLRTPDKRFENLAGFPYEPNYLEIDDGDGGQLRVHYLDEGPRDGELIVCIHGQPVWSYSFRKMIRPLASAGYRVIVPDLVGFGRSDKPSERSDYTFASHVQWMNRFVQGLDLSGITLLGQDWGGPIGLRVVTENLDRFNGIVATNTGLGDAKGVPLDKAPMLRKRLADTPVLPPAEMTEKLRGASSDPLAFMYWVKFCDVYADFDPGEILSLWLNDCSAEEQRAYSAPFPSEEFKQGARQFPSLVPLIPDDPAIPDNRKAWEVLRTLEKPFLTAFSDSDPGHAAVRFQKEVPGAKNQNHATIKGAGHYPQDDAGEELARVVIEFMEKN